MPAQYVIDTNAHVVRTELKGAVNNQDLAHLVHNLRVLFDPTFSEVINFQNCSEIQLKSKDLLVLSTVEPFSKTSKPALVVGSQPSIYGVAHMFQLVRNDTPYVAIFKTMADAESWLGLFEESAPDAIV